MCKKDKNELLSSRLRTTAPPSITGSLTKCGRTLISHLSNFMSCFFVEIYSSCSFLSFVTHQTAHKHHPFGPKQYQVYQKHNHFGIERQKQDPIFRNNKRSAEKKHNTMVQYAIRQANNFHSILMLANNTEFKCFIVAFSPPPTLHTYSMSSSSMRK